MIPASNITEGKTGLANVENLASYTGVGLSVAKVPS